MSSGFKAAIGASSYQDNREREKVFDCYETPSIAIKRLLEVKGFCGPIWDPCDGMGGISSPIIKNGIDVYTSDIHPWTNEIMEIKDFLLYQEPPTRLKNGFNFIMNPPYREAQKFIEHAIKLLDPGREAAFLLRLLFLEGKRKGLYEKLPPKKVYIFSKRIPFIHRHGYKGKKSAPQIAYAWFIWEKGWQGKTELEWI